MKELREYTVTVSIEERSDGTTVASCQVAEIPGLIAEGSTPEEARQNLERVYEPYIRALLRDGLPVPDPTHPIARFGGARFEPGGPPGMISSPLFERLRHSPA